jgi:hypothetical protein
LCGTNEIEIKLGEDSKPTREWRCGTIAAGKKDTNEKFLNILVATKEGSRTTNVLWTSSGELAKIYRTTRGEVFAIRYLPMFFGNLSDPDLRGPPCNKQEHRYLVVAKLRMYCGYSRVT